ncbi:MAG: hypothetical protein JSR54_06340 [Proteobacteria bacterium]|nr:hypothetical protein [Pseudomonadota bacterium]
MSFSLLFAHLKAVRIPLLIALAGAVLAFWVDQIRELFFLLVSADGYGDAKVGALATTVLLGIAVWHSARTVYRFRIRSLPALSDPRGTGLRTWTPRVLGACVPVLMFAASLEPLRDPALAEERGSVSLAMPAAFAVASVALFALFVARRRIGRRLGLPWESDPSRDPAVHAWGELPRYVRRIYLAIMLANVGALVLAAWAPGAIGVIGPIGIILLTASFLTISGTWVTIHGACWDLPVMTLIGLLALACEWSGTSDNHHVRLYPGMESKDQPDWSRTAYVPLGAGSDAAGAGLAFTDYVRGLDGPAPHGPVYLVSAEGGGIRAAAWTTLVLTELERQSNGEFSRHVVAGSGVSGGSLGLAVFAALVKARNDGLIATAQMSDVAADFLLDDFLRGPLEAMFLTDLLQRFVPAPVFDDRGQRLENRWERRWTRALCTSRGVAPADVDGSGPRGDDCHAFERPWLSLWGGPGRVPLLFLNATDVASGTRFIEEPFARMDAEVPDAFVFAGATASIHWLPSTAPLSAVVHNSARFTYVSPAGTLLRQPQRPGAPASRQLVDGGYFENSGLTTLVEVGEVLAKVYDGCHADGSRLAGAACPIRFIHISNDPGVEPMLGRDKDSCRVRPRGGHYGEVSAPVVALLQTRDGRGRTARASVITQYALDSTRTALRQDLERVYHFRLCEGRHHLPLGWTLSPLAWREMQNQQAGLEGLGADVFNQRQTRAIVADTLAAGR